MLKRAIDWVHPGWLLTFLVCALPQALLPGASREAALSQKVTIRRDTYGIPHVLGKSEEAAAFGLGYAQAEDHCQQICRQYVSARGEEAKHFGTGEQSDFLMKLFNNREESARDLSRLPASFRKIVEAFAAGVNLYIAQHRNTLPAWVSAITGADVLANRRAGAIRAVFSRDTIAALSKKYGGPSNTGIPAKPPDEAGAAVPEDADDEGEPGSNAFALSGSKTFSGKPFLLGNPHLNWNSLYWEAQVTVPGKMDFFGSTLAGIPVLRAGFNQYLGWVTTNNAPDLTDVFLLRIDPQNPDHYLFEGKSLPLVRREIAIESRQGDGKPGVIKRVYWESHLGAVIYRSSDKAFAVKSTLIDSFRYYEGFYRLSKAKNLNQFLFVMRMNLIPTSNFTYADAKGNILYLWNARIPRRIDDGTSYKLEVPADNAKYVWNTLHRFDELPRLLNPKGGYIQNCNNPPWYTSLRDPIDARQYPSYLEEERELALRPQIALEMIEAGEKFSIEDVKNLKYSTRMLLAERIKPDLLRALRNLGDPSSDVSEGIALLESWDNRVSGESRGAVLFQRFWDTYSETVPKPFRLPWDPSRPARTPEGISDPSIAVRCLKDAVLWTRQRYGSAGVTWGDVHRFRFLETDLPADGASGTYGLFRVLRFNQSPDGKRLAGQLEKDASPAGFGDAWIIAVEFTRPVRAWSVLAYGQSSLSDSGHSRDQIRLFAEHELRPVWYRQEDILAHLEREYHP